MMAVRLTRNLAAIACAATTASASPFTGEWIGNFTAGSHDIFVRVHLEAAGDSLAGTFAVPLDFAPPQPIQDARADGTRLRFVAARDANLLAFDGVQVADTLRGELAWAEEHSPLVLVRVDATADFDRCVGLYRFDDGRQVSILRSQLGPSYRDWTTGETRGIFPASANRYICGPSFLHVYPPEASLTFLIDGSDKFGGLDWAEGDHVTRALRVEPFTAQEVTVASDGATLAGTVYIPRTPGPHPAVVMVHGSGPATRETYLATVHELTQVGVAVLAYDKRGAGASTGSLQEASLDDLAGDALAAVNLLRSRPDVDPQRVGLMGASQGGWVCPLAASRSPDVAFVVVVSAPAVSPAEQEIYRMSREWSADGAPQERIDHAAGIWRRFFHAAATGEGRDDLTAALDAAAADEDLAPLLPPPLSALPASALFFHLGFEHDPVPVLEAVHCPLLAVFGERDLIVPVAQSARLMAEALARAENTDATIRILPAGNHLLMACRTGTLREIPQLRRYVPGAFEEIVTWITEHAGEGR